MNDKLDSNADQIPIGPTEPADDTEGHYLASYEYARQAAREFKRDTEEDARRAREARAAGRTKKR